MVQERAPYFVGGESVFSEQLLPLLATLFDTSQGMAGAKLD